MSYIQKNLIPGELIIKEGSLTKWIYTRFFLLTLFSFVIAFYKNSGSLTSQSDQLTIALFVFAGMLCFFCAIAGLLFYDYTEIALTDKRFIYKTGIIGRKTTEFRHNEIESVMLDQTIMGRILNYGTLVICGTGDTRRVINWVNKPTDMKNIIYEQITNNHASVNNADPLINNKF